MMHTPFGTAGTVAAVDRFLDEYLSLPCTGGKLVISFGADVVAAAEVIAARARPRADVRLVSQTDGFAALAEVLREATHAAIINATTTAFSVPLAEMMAGGALDGCRVVRLLDASVEVFDLCFAMPRAALVDLNCLVIGAGNRCSRVTVLGAGGEVLEIVFDNAVHGWINSCGAAPPRNIVFLPPGEVATYSNHIDGEIVFTGAINANFQVMRDPRLADRPVHLTVKTGRVTAVECADPLVEAVILRILSLENGDRIGEVGFGTNEGIVRYVPFLSHINERHPGLHLGLGADNQGDLPGPRCPLHLDFIGTDGAILFDGFPVFHDGYYDRQALAAIANTATEAPRRVGLVDTL
ncbi:hypothetical protein [Azospirillum argentinense]